MRVEGRKRKDRRMSEINITPFVDVMLVLLVIFMVTAPLLTSGIPINLPKSKGEAISAEDKVLDINIDAQGKTYIGSEEISIKALIPKVKSIVKENPSIRIMISADRNSNYGTVIGIMGMLKEAGFSSIGLKTDANTLPEK